MHSKLVCDRYQTLSDEVQIISKQVLAKLKDHRFPPDPIHYTLFFELLTEIDPAISEEIAKAIEFDNYDRQTADLLFRALWSPMFYQQLQTKAFSRTTEDFSSHLHDWLKNDQQLSADLEHHLQILAELQSPEQMLNGIQDQILPTIAAYQQQTNLLKTQVQTADKDIKRLQQELEKANCLAKTDELTNLPNRRGLNEKLQQAVQTAREQQQTFSLLMIDIDYFKAINDEHGHLLGDSVLRYLAKILQTEIKGKDSIARIGGEEFVILLPDTHYSNALKVADNIRLKIASRSLKTKNNKNIQMTVSIGVAIYQLNETTEQLMDRADHCMYYAKNHGRNMTVGETQLA